MVKDDFEEDNDPIKDYSEKKYSIDKENKSNNYYQKNNVNYQYKKEKIRNTSENRQEIYAENIVKTIILSIVAIIFIFQFGGMFFIAGIFGCVMLILEYNISANTVFSIACAVFTLIAIFIGERAYKNILNKKIPIVKSILLIIYIIAVLLYCFVSPVKFNNFSKGNEIKFGKYTYPCLSNYIENSEYIYSVKINYDDINCYAIQYRNTFTTQDYEEIRTILENNNYERLYFISLMDEDTYDNDDYVYIKELDDSDKFEYIYANGEIILYGIGTGDSKEYIAKMSDKIFDLSFKINYESDSNHNSDYYYDY